MSAWIPARNRHVDLGAGVLLAVVLWVGSPFVLLAGSVIWVGVPPVTAAVLAGDWLLELLLIGVVLGLLG